MKKRATKTKVMAAFQAQRVLEAEKRIRSTRESKGRNAEVKKLEMDKRALEERWRKYKQKRTLWKRKCTL